MSFNHYVKLKQHQKAKSKYCGKDSTGSHWTKKATEGWMWANQRTAQLSYRCYDKYLEQLLAKLTGKTNVAGYENAMKVTHVTRNYAEDCTV